MRSRRADGGALAMGVPPGWRPMRGVYRRRPIAMIDQRQGGNAMAESPLSGGEWFARALAAAGTTHVFFIDAILRRTLVELDALGVSRVLAHSEKAAAYMADGYARIAGRPGICMAQSVGAANLASGLQDAFLGRSPVIAVTGHKPPSFQHRNAYQELQHAPLFAAVTKFTT